MIDIYLLANYITQRYERTFKVKMDEMKLHKLLYFIQRESFVLYGRPMFVDQFEAWKYGPVMRCLRNHQWKTSALVDWPEELSEQIKIVDVVFEKYASKDSWTLSNISHGESCWRKAKDREISSPVEILTKDIQIDAQNVLIRRAIFNN